jgi:hypothetical protein
MPKPNITLKKVKIFNGHDGVGLDCDLYVDGVKVAHVFDAADGGEIEYQPYGNTPADVKSNRKKIEELEAYAKSLPEVPCIFREGDTVPQDLDSLINNILVEMEKEKEAKKLEKKFPTHIISYNKETGASRMVSYGKPVVLLSRVPLAKLQQSYNNLKAQQKAGDEIINTNLRALGIVI